MSLNKKPRLATEAGDDYVSGMREIDLEPDDYRDSNEPREPVHEPVLTQQAPIIFSVIFCVGFAIWLASKVLHGFIAGIIGLLLAHH